MYRLPHFPQSRRACVGTQLALRPPAAEGRISPDPPENPHAAIVPVARPATPGGTGRPAYLLDRQPLDMDRIGHAALVSGLAQGVPLGLSFALSGLARASGPAHVKVLAGFLPVAAALATAPGEQALRNWLGSQATLPAQPTLAQDAIPGVLLFLTNLAWQRLPGPPRPPAASVVGLAATVGISMVGSLIGGALSEALSQTAPAPPGTLPIPASHKGMGRALSLLPLALWLQVPACMATAGRPLPRWSGLAGTGLACAGWTFRRILTNPPERPKPPVSA